MEILFDEARAYLYISVGLGRSIDLNPKQALELMDFLLQRAEDIRGYTLVEQMHEAEAGMQALESKMWEKYQNGRDKPSEEAIDYYIFDLKQGEKVIDQMTFKCSSEQEAYLRAEEAMADGQECELVEVQPAI